MLLLYLFCLPLPHPRNDHEDVPNVYVCTYIYKTIVHSAGARLQHYRSPFEVIHVNHIVCILLHYN